MRFIISFIQIILAFIQLFGPFIALVIMAHNTFTIEQYEVEYLIRSLYSCITVICCTLLKVFDYEKEKVSIIENIILILEDHKKELQINKKDKEVEKYMKKYHKENNDVEEYMKKYHKELNLS